VRFIVDVDGPADSVDGTIVEDSHGDDFHGPAFTAPSLTEALTGAGQRYDPAKGVVIVVSSFSVELELTSGGPALVPNGTGWVTGNAEPTVMFANVELGIQTLTRSGDGLATPIVVTAGQITWVHLPTIQL
jgi:hypothetical protein